MNAQDTRCLVTGATGYIGGRLVPHLLAAGYTVRAMARTPEKLADAPWRSDVEVVPGDLDDADSLVKAFDGVDVVYYLVHSMGSSKDFVDAERRAAENVVAAARRTGVRRIVYLGGLHPKDTKLSDHLASRTQVGDILLESGIETVVLQAGVVVGAGSASFEMIRHLTDRLPVMTTPKWVHNKIQPIAIDDALHYLTGAASAAVPESRTWDIGGPDVLEYGDMMQVYAEAARLRPRRFVVLPWLTPSLASRWIGLVTPIPPGLAGPLIESLECDAVASEHDIDAVIPPPPGGLTPYREAVEAALRSMRTGDLEPDPTRAAPADRLPSDPAWAGETVFRDVRSAVTSASPDRVWKAIEAATQQPGGWFSYPLGVSARRWTVEAHEHGSRIRMRATGFGPGEAWLELRVTPDDGGARYEQRVTFVPHGLGGLAYWYSLLPLHRLAFRRLLDSVLRDR
ncbi:SDR family oxidoreductase [Mycobacterium sp. MYCO198283]|uniref:DUF2867 domain-containing protein n=1 Tax=Mycobacterium sp. MYCO198283 TaxID=2883505 RepID=UPI001E50D5CE|nr:DUF2867 domain-containing protein [Mycobacterium sp. MYCO198283]MCG5431292.1 SDR family oxidoreductase [Mycobacterium sp. MYCO198283]